MKGFAICFEALFKGGFCGGVVFVIALPSFEGGALKGASVREGDGPWERAVIGDFLKVFGGLFWGLAARKEDDTGEIFGYELFKDFGGPVADLSWGGLGFVLFAGENHVDFKNGGGEVDFLAF